MGLTRMQVKEEADPQRVHGAGGRGGGGKLGGHHQSGGF